MSSTCRRRFLKQAMGLAVAAPFAAGRDLAALAGQPGKPAAPSPRSPVAIARCPDYSDAAVRAGLSECFNLLGGLDKVAAGKTATIKINLTGNEFWPLMGLSVGETYMTHYATVYHLTALLLAAGARRVRVVESTGRRSPLEATLIDAGWDVKALGALGTVAFENTRNRGSFDSYATLKSPDGVMFGSFELNRAYADTDVMISLAKLKQHDTTGVTLTMKNMFGITPSSMYGGKAGDEDSTAGRGAIHDARRYGDLELPGQNAAFQSPETGVRVPTTIVDLGAARPVDIAIIDAVSAVTGGESRYSAGPLMRVVRPGVLIAGRNAVSVDAVGTAIMGFDPLATRTGVFAGCENHLMLADQRGLGTADPARIEIRGVGLADARCPYVLTTG